MSSGQGRVLVVDGGGSLRCALLGDMLAKLAARNGWAVRDPAARGRRRLRSTAGALAASAGPLARVQARTPPHPTPPHPTPPHPTPPHPTPPHPTPPPKGVIVNGCIRDSEEIASIDLGVKALATMPIKSSKRDPGVEVGPRGAARCGVGRQG
jgi:hypothetical protein